MQRRHFVALVLLQLLGCKLADERQRVWTMDADADKSGLLPQSVLQRLASAYRSRDLNAVSRILAADYIHVECRGHGLPDSYMDRSEELAIIARVFEATGQNGLSLRFEGTPELTRLEEGVWRIDGLESIVEVAAGGPPVRRRTAIVVRQTAGLYGWEIVEKRLLSQS